MNLFTYLLFATTKHLLNKYRGQVKNVVVRDLRHTRQILHNLQRPPMHTDAEQWPSKVIGYTLYTVTDWDHREDSYISNNVLYHTLSTLPHYFGKLNGEICQKISLK